MALVNPTSVAEVVQKLYEIAKLIQEQVALYKNIGPRLHVLSLDLLATADLVSNAPLADKKREYVIKDHLVAFMKEAECIIKVLKAQKESIFGRLRTFAFAGSINSKIDDLDARLTKFQHQYQLLELDNLSAHMNLLPGRIAEAMKDAERTTITFANAKPTDLISIIADPTARDFWTTNFGMEMTTKEDRMRTAFLAALSGVKGYAAKDLKDYFDAIWDSMTDDMDANHDDLITVFEYRNYVEDGNMMERFEEMWLAAGHQLTKKVTAEEETLPSINTRQRLKAQRAPAAAPSPASASTPGAPLDLVAQVVALDSTSRKKAAKEMGVDVAFVVDCTSSMGDWIDQVKTKMGEISDQIGKDQPLVRQRFAFVGYRDFNDGDERFVTHNFTSSMETLGKFLGKVEAKATGKTDTPEDVLGGLKSMLLLNWQADVRIAILLGDAPCHGEEYYEPTDNNGKPVSAAKFDYFPKGDPEKNDPKAIVEQIADDKVHLVMCRIPNPTRGVITDIMVKKFTAFYDARAALKGQQMRASVVNLQDSASLFVSKILESLTNAIGESELLSVHSRRKMPAEMPSVIPSNAPHTRSAPSLHPESVMSMGVIPSSAPKHTESTPSLHAESLKSAGVIPSSVPKQTSKNTKRP